jgi:hypothetical protein
MGGVPLTAVSFPGLYLLDLPAARQLTRYKSPTVVEDHKPLSKVTNASDVAGIACGLRLMRN